MIENVQRSRVMNKDLKILFIEDNEDDVLLISRKLKKEGFTFSHKVIKTAAELEDSVKNERWDLILSDYSLPGFTGFDALKIYKN